MRVSSMCVLVSVYLHSRTKMRTVFIYVSTLSPWSCFIDLNLNLAILKLLFGAFPRGKVKRFDIHDLHHFKHRRHTPHRRRLLLLVVIRSRYRRRFQSNVFGRLFRRRWRRGIWRRYVQRYALLLRRLSLS